MYERFYQLRERPFALSPDPDYLYPSRVHREALDYLRYGIESHAGFVVITGEIGSGKTTLLQTLLRGLDSQTTVARIVNTMLEPRELLETIMIDFGLDPAGPQQADDAARSRRSILVDQRLAGRLVLLVIDEAQNLSLAALEELRMLSNLETEKSKLLQIVLVGQPNLRDKLAAPELEQLRQRITVSYHLAPLDADETANYVNHRLRARPRSARRSSFPRDVTDVVHTRSRGVPRIINVICDADAASSATPKSAARSTSRSIDEVLVGAGDDRRAPDRASDRRHGRRRPRRSRDWQPRRHAGAACSGDRRGRPAATQQALRRARARQPGRDGARPQRRAAELRAARSRRCDSASASSRSNGACSRRSTACCAAQRRRRRRRAACRQARRHRCAAPAPVRRAASGAPRRVRARVAGASDGIMRASLGPCRRQDASSGARRSW